MATDGISANKGPQQTSQQSSFKSFEKLADQLNSTIPDRTTTIEEKKKAIAVKKQLLAHPGCPDGAKKELQKDIETIQDEISRIEAQNSSIFD